MINEGLAKSIIDSFGFSKRKHEEKKQFKNSLGKFRIGCPKQGSRATNMAGFVGLIETTLSPEFMTLHDKGLASEYISSQDQASEKIAEALGRLKDNVSGLISRLQGRNQELNNKLDTLNTGVRTAFMITALVCKTIVDRLNEAGELTKENFDKFFQAGLAFTQEIASLPQVMFHSVINYLCGDKLDMHFNSATHIHSNKKFIAERFKINSSTGDLGLENDFLSNLRKTFAASMKSNSAFAKNYRKAKKIPVFGCPAKYARLELVIDGRKKIVDFIEAMYRIAVKAVSENLFTSVASAA